MSSISISKSRKIIPVHDSRLHHASPSRYPRSLVWHRIVYAMHALRFAEMPTRLAEWEP